MAGNQGPRRDEQIKHTAAAGFAAARVIHERHLASLDFDDFVVAYVGTPHLSAAVRADLREEHEAMQARQSRQAADTH